MKKVLTICPYCGCGCGLYLTVEKDKVVGVLPSVEHPVSQGKLCVKGWNAHEFIHHPERLKTPLVRENGRLKEVSWDEAFRTIIDAFKRIISMAGSNAIFVLSSAKCTNEENYLLMKFARTVIGTNNIDNCARLCHSSSMGGLATAFGSGAMTNSIEEIEEANVLLIIGSNTTDDHPMIGARVIRAIDRGATLIVADPRVTPISKLAHIYLQPRVGTDVAWLNGMMNIIISENLVDISFIKRRTENFDELARVVSRYTPEFVENITGIPEEKLIQAARVYASDKKAMLIYGMGLTQHTTGVDNVKACADLAMLTAHVGHRVSGINPLRGQNNVQGACDMGALPDVYTGYQKIIDNKVRKKFETAWDRKLPKNTGLTLTEAFESAINGKIKGMYIMGENPLVSNPDINTVEKVLDSLEFLVVQDIFLTKTAQKAHVILPGACFAEKDGTFTNTERRVQRVKKAVEPPGKAMADIAIICELSSRMGYPMEYKGAYEVMEEIALLTPIYSGIFFYRLEEGWGLQWPCKDRTHLGTPFLHRKRFTRGQGSFTAVEYKPPAEERDENYPFILTTGRSSFRYHTGTMCGRTSTLERELPENYVNMNPSDANPLGIKNGSYVKVASRRGEIITMVAVNDSVPAGVVFIPFQYSNSPVNILTNPTPDPEAKIPEYKVCAVRIEPIPPHLP
ncbi:MAG: formate dehydrogenase subunit alpha [Nitrospirota bacterium]